MEDASSDTFCHYQYHIIGLYSSIWPYPGRCKPTLVSSLLWC